MATPLHMLLSCLLALVMPTGFALDAPLTPPFQHWRTAKRGSLQGCNSNVHDVTSYGASTSADATINQAAINAAFAAMEPCDTLLIPKGNFTVIGGISGSNLRNATIVINGVLNFVDPDGDGFSSWPMDPKKDYTKQFANCFSISDSIDVAITSDEHGTLNGNGKVWWDMMILGELPPNNDDSRPLLVSVDNSSDVLVEYIDLVNSPKFNLWVNAVRAEIRYVSVVTDRDYLQQLKTKAYGSIKDRIEKYLLDKAVDFLPSKFLQPEDLNTDGIDPSGIDFWIHDIDISNDDDSIAVKPSKKGTVGIDGTQYDCSQNMLIENAKLVGFGASIGSVPPNVDRKCVDGITMRNLSMPGTGKGIYVKSNGNDCIGKTSQLTNLRYEDVKIEEPFWYAIWIGPQQQQEPGTSLGLDCSLIYPFGDSQCPTQGCSDFENITLKNVEIKNPMMSPGAILGNSTNPMRNVVFDNVVVKQHSSVLGRLPWYESSYPWTGKYKSKHVSGTCIDCSPVPDGFTVQTSSRSSRRLSSETGLRHEARRPVIV